MKSIPLTRGMVALIDDADVELISRYKWHALSGKKHPKRVFRAGTTVTINGKRKMVLMHRLLLGLEHGDPRQADHINHDQLDNRRSNLRIATQTENVRNRGPQKAKAVPFKGVFKSPPKNKKTPFQAAIVADGITYGLGRFATAEAAARAYDTKARELHGEFAYQNF